MMAATFENVEKPHDIALYIRVGIFDGVANTCLGGEVDNPLGFFAQKNFALGIFFFNALLVE